MRIGILFCCGLLTLTYSVNVSTLHAQQASEPVSDRVDTGAATEAPQHHEAFRKMLDGVKLVGQFTVLGRENQPLAKEEYTIRSVTKLPRGDYWQFQTRIVYGKFDVTLPLPLEVKWAGDTPVITLTDVTLPGLGTFSSRVVLYKGRYAGTWTHGEAKGHLFGVIEKLDESE